MTKQPTISTALPPHSWTRDGVTYRWGGASTCLCSSCHELFTSHYAFDAHQKDGQCRNPASLRRPSDDEPMFIKIDKPTWNPPYVWVRHVPGREPYTGPASDE